MTTITNFAASASDGAPVPADAHGNNVAIKCLSCGNPVLAVVREHQRGESAANPAICRRCGSSYWVEPVLSESRLVVHRVESTYGGRYSLAREPNHTAAANIASWQVIAAMMKAYGSAEYEDLAVAVRQHDHHAGGRAFVDYCIRNGWLKKA